MQLVGSFTGPVVESLDFDASSETAQGQQDFLKRTQEYMRQGQTNLAIDRYKRLTDLTNAQRDVLATAHFELAIWYQTNTNGQIDLAMAATHYRLAAINGHDNAEEILSALIKSDPHLEPYSWDSYYDSASFHQRTNVAFDNHDTIQPVPWEDQQQSPYFAYGFETSLTHLHNTHNSLTNTVPTTTSPQPLPAANNPNPPENSLTKAKQLLGDQQFKEAEKMYRVLALENNIVGQAACCQLSIMYKVGLGVDINLEEAKAFLLQAAKKGNLDSYVALGDMAYESGDYVACYEHYQKSGDESKIKDITNFMLREAARSIRIDVKSAQNLYQALAKYGHIEAMLQLGSMHMHYVDIKDYSKAELYLTKVCSTIQSKQEKTTEDKERLRRGASLLGDLFSMQQSSVKAATSYQTAHDNDDYDAALKLARLHMKTGLFEKERPADVIRWCTVAALDKNHTQINHEFIAWYENRPFWASKIDDLQQRQLVANFYIRAEKELPSELAQFKSRSTNNNDT